MLDALQTFMTQAILRYIPLQAYYIIASKQYITQQQELNLDGTLKKNL